MADELERLVAAVQAGPRYAAISAQLVRRVGAQELAKGRGLKEAVKTTRARLHQAAGAYQESGINYPRWRAALDDLPADLHAPQVRDFCRAVMAEHASTRERLPILEQFYGEIFAPLGPVEAILDVACGLNPLALPWMPLAPGARYACCDVYPAMIDFLNAFFRHFQIDGQAFICDLTAALPERPVQLSLALKTLPCLEQLDKSIGPRLLDGLPGRYLLLSFPSRSLGGRGGKGMPANYEAHLQGLLAGRAWPVTRYEFPGELAFLIEKV